VWGVGGQRVKEEEMAVINFQRLLGAEVAGRLSNGGGAKAGLTISRFTMVHRWVAAQCACGGAQGR
jgi:hypothetical protein